MINRKARSRRVGTASKSAFAKKKAHAAARASRAVAGHPILSTPNVAANAAQVAVSQVAIQVVAAVERAEASTARVAQAASRLAGAPLVASKAVAASAAAAAETADARQMASPACAGLPFRIVKEHLPFIRKTGNRP